MRLPLLHLEKGAAVGGELLRVVRYRVDPRPALRPLHVPSVLDVHRVLFVRARVAPVAVPRRQVDAQNPEPTPTDDVRRPLPRRVPVRYALLEPPARPHAPGRQLLQVGELQHDARRVDPAGEELLEVLLQGPVAPELVRDVLDHERI